MGRVSLSLPTFHLAADFLEHRHLPWGLHGIRDTRWLWEGLLGCSTPALKAHCPGLRCRGPAHSLVQRGRGLLLLSDPSVLAAKYRPVPDSSHIPRPVTSLRPPGAPPSGSFWGLQPILVGTLYLRHHVVLHTQTRGILTSSFTSNIVLHFQKMIGVVWFKCPSRTYGHSRHKTDTRYVGSPTGPAHPAGAPHVG